MTSKCEPLFQILDDFPPGKVETKNPTRGAGWDFRSIQRLYDCQGADVCTVSALLKKVSGDWKIAWMQRSGGDADLESWS